MSKRYIGGLITKSPTVPTTSAAPGIWTLDQAQYYIKAGTWPLPPPNWAGAFTSGDLGIFYNVRVDGSGNIFAYGMDFSTSSVLLQRTSLTSGAQSFAKTYTSANGTITNPQATEASSFMYVDSSSNVYMMYAFGYNGGGILKVNSTGVVQASKYSTPGFLNVALGLDGGNNLVKWSTTYLTTGGWWNVYSYDFSLNVGTNIQAGISGGFPGVYTMSVDQNGDAWGLGQLGNGTNDNLLAKQFSFYRISYGDGYANGAGSVALEGTTNVYFAMKSSTGKLRLFKAPFNVASVTWGRLVSPDVSVIRTIISGTDWYLLTSTSTSNEACVTKVNTSGSILYQYRFTVSAGSDFQLTDLAVSGTSMVLCGRLNSRPLLILFPKDGGDGLSWTIGSTTISCASSSVFTLSNVSATTSGVSNNSNTPYTSANDTISTNNSPTLTWSR